MGGSLLRSRVFDRCVTAALPLTLQYPGVQVSIVHPDSEPPLISLEAVGGSPPVVAAPSKIHHLSVVPLPGADNEIRVFEPLAITGIQLVKNLSTHKFT